MRLLPCFVFSFVFTAGCAVDTVAPIELEAVGDGVVVPSAPPVGFVDADPVPMDEEPAVDEELEGPDGLEDASEAVGDDEEDVAMDEHFHDDDGEEVDDEVADGNGLSGGCASRWQPTAAASDVGDEQEVPYTSAGPRCTGGATSGAQVLADALRERFGDRINRAIPGDGIQIYNCRAVRAGQSLSLHAVGRALDVFIPRSGGAADNRLGDPIAHWLMVNADHIGVQFLIWDRTRWKASGATPRNRCYGGVHPHDDHIHVELTPAASREETPFFQGAPEPEAPPEAAAEPAAPPAAPPEAAPEPDPEPAPPVAAPSFVGEACRTNADCPFEEAGVPGHCYRAYGPANGVGFCSLPCAGLCPDRPGFAMTFCAPTEALGARPGFGRCVSKAAAENRQCSDRADMVPLEVERFRGRSGVPHAWANVCAPIEALTAPAPPPAAGNARAAATCGDGGLAMSEHARPCAGVPDETWRCACSASHGAVVSQVCRNGAWINYHLDPDDCSTCVGDYSRGCE